MQNRVEFCGGPKDGELIFSRPEFLGKMWMKPVLEVRLSSEPSEFYTYELHDAGPNEKRYQYLGVVVKDENPSGAPGL